MIHSDLAPPETLKIDRNNFSKRSWKFWTEPLSVEVDGVETAYRRGGQGETLVYLHGGGGTRQWGPLHQKLAKYYDVIAPEHPGYGDTPRHEDQDSWADFVLHYDAFFRALGLEKVHLVGTSLGAWLAVNLAIYNPERYASLTLITPLGLRIVDEPFIDVFRFSPEQGLDVLFNGRAENCLDQLEQEGGLEDQLQAFHEDTTAALLFWNPRYDYKLDRRLQRVRIPALILAAEDDRVAGNQQAPRYAQLLSDSHLKTLPGPLGQPSSHAMVFEQSDDVVNAINTFLDGKR